MTDKKIVRPKKAETHPEKITLNLKSEDMQKLLLQAEKEQRPVSQMARIIFERALKEQEAI